MIGITLSAAVKLQVAYGSKCFASQGPVLLKREPTNGHGYGFSSPNLPPGWSIDPFTGDIEGIAEAGERGSIQVYAMTEAGVVNTAVSYEIAPRSTDASHDVLATVKETLHNAFGLWTLDFQVRWTSSLY
jgi:hypothetical protein